MSGTYPYGTQQPYGNMNMPMYSPPQTYMDRLQSQINQAQQQFPQQPQNQPQSNQQDTNINWIRISTMELDIDNTTTWSWITTSSPYGSYRLSINIQENLPTNIFTLPPTIDMMCYCNNENYSFLNICSAPPSKAYTGKWQTIMLDKAGTVENKPTSFHLVIKATGF